MTQQRFHKMMSVLDHRQLDLTLITDQVHKGRNLAALQRNADAFGIKELHTVVPERGYRPYRGTAMGSQLWVDVVFHKTIADAITLVKEQGMQVVAAHLSDSAIDYRDLDYTVPTALIMGTEKQGVSQAALDQADHHIVIPTVGMVDSLNVSVACGIILSEAQRQRSLKPEYGQKQWTTQEYKNKLFEWMQPVLAEFCQREGIAYPELDEDGDIKHASEWLKQHKGTSK